MLPTFAGGVVRIDRAVAYTSIARPRGSRASLTGASRCHGDSEYLLAIAITGAPGALAIQVVRVHTGEVVVQGLGPCAVGVPGVGDPKEGATERRAVLTGQPNGKKAQASKGKK